MEKEATDKELQQIDDLANKLLEVVMNSEMDSPAVAIAALGHIASMVANEAGFTEQVFAYCMIDSFQTVLELDKKTEVH
jgi:predicted transcriptional regulator